MKRAFCTSCQTYVRAVSDFGRNSNHMDYYCKECDTELSYNFKFCILTAGVGSRNNDISGLHKALLPLENKPIISHIIEKLDPKIEIVIALGYKGEQIKNYLDEGLVNIIGGCCGTNQNHIKEIYELTKNYSPRKIKNV